ncbi:hypothetical protein [Halopiger xanaduensis]|uniref:DUF8052 domain-containing protein n=1 Tax=Halopiger xanaduensis (strain DSM 18323 / JCM 14033 / SH-6) TaxID=797210 RepID=F8D8B1_HALXS|nr:hypothetical protein [Halopiger xanaduensis]AEH36823.1 hypothetical protein Halxa_2198 [Halopiger xanaduensis SH-6]
MSDRERRGGDIAGSERSIEGTESEPEPSERSVPDWDDEYVDRVSDRLMHNYDLEKDRAVAGERFTLYGEMNLVSQKHFLHPAISLAEHESNEHLFVQRVDRLDDETLDRYVDLGHELADDEEWLEPDEEHFATEFTFVAVAPSIPDDVRRRVADFSERTLLKYGYHGHYEINLVVVAPDREELVANENADVEAAFRLWDEIEREEPGILGLIARRLQL